MRAFKAAPTLVKVLAASFYLSGLFALWLAVDTAVVLGMVSIEGVILALICLLVALVEFLLGKGIARGSRGAWPLALLLYAIAVPVTVLGAQRPVPRISILNVGISISTSTLNVVIAITTLVLLLTPVVRQHCKKK